MNNKGEWGCATNIEGFSFVVATEKQAPTVYLVNHDEDGKMHILKSQVKNGWTTIWLRAQLH